MAREDRSESLTTWLTLSFLLNLFLVLYSPAHFAYHILHPCLKALHLPLAEASPLNAPNAERALSSPKWCSGLLSAGDEGQAALTLNVFYAVSCGGHLGLQMTSSAPCSNRRAPLLGRSTCLLLSSGPTVLTTLVYSPSDAAYVNRISRVSRRTRGGPSELGKARRSSVTRVDFSLITSI